MSLYTLGRRKILVSLINYGYYNPLDDVEFWKRFNTKTKTKPYVRIVSRIRQLDEVSITKVGPVLGDGGSYMVTYFDRIKLAQSYPYLENIPQPEKELTLWERFIAFFRN